MQTKGANITLLTNSDEEEPPSANPAVSSYFNKSKLNDSIYDFLPSKLFQENFEDFKSDFIVADKTKDFIRKFFPTASLDDWNNWRWQIRNSITDYQKLKEIFGQTIAFNFEIEKKLPVRITPYYASLVYRSKQLEKAVIPSMQELILSNGESIDPLSEEHDRPVHCLVHRYPDRVLFLSTNFCSTNCRYCTRSRIVGNKNFTKKQIKEWDLAFEYIRNNPKIRDVVISGGDPLTLPDISIEYLLSNLRKIPHVEIIRIGTKVPVVLPMRITRKLLKMLKKYHPLFMSIHFTHADELTSEVQEACNNIANNGIVMGSQTVLLKDINEEPEDMKKLFNGLLKVRIRPYYLYQCDPITGSSHFRTPVESGIKIIEALRGWTSGYAIPHYVIDAPGGGGKIPLLPEYFRGKDQNGNIKLRNYENREFFYYDCN